MCATLMTTFAAGGDRTTPGRGLVIRVLSWDRLSLNVAVTVDIIALTVVGAGSLAACGATGRAIVRGRPADQAVSGIQLPGHITIKMKRIAIRGMTLTASQAQLARPTPGMALMTSGRGRRRR